jgi:glycosyltransferase involved in cell wall biosynthesis
MKVMYVDATLGLYGASKMLLALLQNLDPGHVRPYVVLSNDVDEGDMRLAHTLHYLRIPTLQYPLAVFRRSKYLNPAGAAFLLGALVRSTRLLVRLIRKHRIDLVQTNTSTVLSGAIAARIAGVPHIYHVHEIFGALDALIFPPMLDALSDRVVVISDAAARSLLAHRPSLARKLVTIRNGINPAPFRNVTDAQVAHLRQELNLPPGDSVIGMVGRIGTWKGEENLIRVAKLVLNRVERVHFVIAGGTFDRRDHLLDDLRGKIDAEDLAGRVIVTGLRDDIPALMNLFSVLVHLPNKPEPFGLVITEAMASGKPVVVWDTGALPEIVEHGKTGWIAPNGDVEAAADYVVALLTAPAQSASMGKAGSLRVDRDFSAIAHARQFEALYQEIKDGI